METVLFYIMLYLIGAAGIFMIFMIRYHRDKPWYTWGSTYSRRTVYWIGVVFISGFILVGWWYMAIRMILLKVNTNGTGCDRNPQ